MNRVRALILTLLLAFLSGCFPNASNTPDGTYNNPTHGTFTVKGGSATYTLNGASLAFFNTGHEPFIEGKLQTLYVSDDALAKVPKLYSALEGSDSWGNYAVIGRFYGGALRAGGHLYRKSGHIVARTYTNDKYGTFTIMGREIVYEIDDHLFTGDVNDSEPQTAYIDGIDEAMSYLAPLGCTGIMDENYLSIKGNTIRTRSGIEFTLKDH